MAGLILIFTIILIVLVVFFAINMGASGIAPSFAGAYGGKLIKKKDVFILFSLFVILGAVCFGKDVAVTLGKGLLPKGLLDFKVVLVIISSATLSLFLANILKIPQSTSQVTVGAIVGVGLFFQHLNQATLFFKILPLWIILPLSSFILTFLLYRIIYPPGQNNLHIYEKIFSNETKLKLASLITSCYVAFAIGTNNVANAVGPLSGAGIISIAFGLVAIAPLFGVGALLLGKGTLETAGKEIVPLGPISGTLVSFITASLLIFASLLGIPQSLVQLNLASIFAISCLKNGHRSTLDHHLTRKTFIVWIITPVLSVVISYVLLAVFVGRQ